MSTPISAMISCAAVPDAGDLIELGHLGANGAIASPIRVVSCFDLGGEGSTRPSIMASR